MLLGSIQDGGIRKRGVLMPFFGPDNFLGISCRRIARVRGSFRAMTGQFRTHVGRQEVLQPEDRAVLFERGPDDFDLGVARRNVAAVAPLAHGDALFVDIGSHRLGVAVPYVENLLEML